MNAKEILQSIAKPKGLKVIYQNGEASVFDDTTHVGLEICKGSKRGYATIYFD